MKSVFELSLSNEDMEGFATFDIISIGTGDIDNSDEFGAASWANIDDEFIEIFHDEVESHAGAALFLFDLVVAHGEASHEVSADFFGGEGTEPVMNGDDEIRSIASEGEEARFVGLQIDGDGSLLSCVRPNAVWVDGGVIDGVHEQFIGDAGDGGDDAFIDADVGGINRHGIEEGIFLKTRRNFICRWCSAVAQIFIDAEDIISDNLSDGCNEFFW